MPRSPTSASPIPRSCCSTERGHEQAAAAHRALAGVELDLVVTSTPAANGRDGRGRRAGCRAAARGRVRGVARRTAGRRAAGRARAGVRRVADDQRRSTSASSAASRSVRRSIVCCPRSTALVARRGRPRSRSSTAGSNRILHLARARRRPRVLRHVRAGAGVHQRARPRRRRPLDRAHRQLHPVRPAPPGARDDDGASLARAAGVARAETDRNDAAECDRRRRCCCGPVSRSASSTCASSTVTTG